MSRAVIAAVNCDSNDCDITASLRDMRTKSGAKTKYNGKLRVFSIVMEAYAYPLKSRTYWTSLDIFGALDTHEKRGPRLKSFPWGMTQSLIQYLI